MTETWVEVAVTVPDELPRDLLVRTAMRTTLGVLVELISESKNHLILGSPFMQFGKVFFHGPLGIAIESAVKRDVLIDIVSTSGSLINIDSESLSPHRLPMSIRVSQPRANLVDPEILGSHAKFCIADYCAAYIGSANFTEKGLTKHFEVGTLMRGQPVKDFWSVVNRLFTEEFFTQRGWLVIPDK
jgi:phosphatidylserine/phosphatidylglycerophosphate/cardiolipin synthase-like enzyme